MRGWRESLEDGKMISLRGAAIFAVSILLIRQLLLATVENKEIFLPIDDSLMVISGGIATAGLFYAAWNSDKRSQKAWMILAFAMVADTFGEAAWMVIEVVLHQNPFPSVADLGYHIFYPLAFVAIILLPENPVSRRESLKIFLDAGIAIIVFILIFWTFILAPIVASSDGTTFELVVSVAYPIMDVLLFIALIELIYRKISSPETAPLVLLALGMIAVLVVDMLFAIQIQQGTYVSGGLMDIGWFICDMFFFLSGVMQADSKSFGRSDAFDFILSRRASWTQYLPYLGIAVAYLLIIWNYQNSIFISQTILAILIGVIVGMMFVRQKLTLDESNQMLAMALSESVERKRAEDKLKASLAEKEILLEEVHHRVKNNLQVVSTLLYLQSLNFDDERIIKIFKDSQDRIKSIALVHENLYKSESLGKVDFSEYIKQLVSYLSQSYNDISGKINFKVDSDGVSLNINTAIACGMVISELVSNSLKYAFPDGRDGEIYIGLSSEGDNFMLIVSDNGVGIKGDLNIKDSETLGLQLVDTLVKQIDGEMSYDMSHGARYEIHFKESKQEVNR